MRPHHTRIMPAGLIAGALLASLFAAAQSTLLRSARAPPAAAAAPRALGLTVEPVRARAVVTSIAADGPAARAGLHIGDMLVTVDDRPAAELARIDPGRSPHEVTVLRDGVARRVRLG